MREIAQEGRAILLTTHQLDIAEQLSDRVAIIQAGEIIAEEPTRELIRQFSGSAYTIELESPLDEKRSQAIAALGAVIEAEQTVYVQGSDTLYQVFAILQPLPILRVKKDQADLTGIFLKLVREGRDA